MRTTGTALIIAATLHLAGSPAASTSNDVARARVGQFMEQAAQEGFTGAVLVARKDQILLEKGYGTLVPGGAAPVRADSVFTIGSITKQFTAAAILKLQEEGRLSTNDRIGRYFDDVPADKKGVTVHHLLSHQAGFPGAIGDDRERIGREDFIALALNTPLLFPPGEGYDYSNVGYSLAAAIVEKITGKRYEAYLRETFFLPAGMKDTGYRLPGWSADRLAHGTTSENEDWGTLVDRAFGDDGPGWHLVGNGGMHSTVGDMFRWHRSLTSGAALSESSRELMYGRHADEGDGVYYGYGWTVRETPWGRLVKHNGGNGIFFADFLRYIEEDVVIYFSTSVAARDRRMTRLGVKLADAVLGETVPRLEPPPVPILHAGDGPDAPEGTPAARWGLPGTPGGQTAGRFLDAVAGSDDAARRAFVRSGMEPGLVERNGADRLVNVLNDLRDQLGDLDVVGLQQRSAGEVAIVVNTGEEPGPMRIILRLENGPAGRITRIELEVGD